MPDQLDFAVMVLSDRTIREEIAAGRIRIDPFDDALVQPCSIDVTVGDAFRVFRNSRYPYIDVKVPMEDLTELVTVTGGEAFILHPGEFVLGVVAERITLPDDIVATLDGKSSLGRLGLVVHQTAGVVDAGFDGHITLELANVANLPITVYPGMRIAQLSFMTLTTPADNPYGSGTLGSKYQGAKGAGPSRPRAGTTSTSPRAHEGAGHRCLGVHRFTGRRRLRAAGPPGGALLTPRPAAT